MGAFGVRTGIVATFDDFAIGVGLLDMPDGSGVEVNEWFNGEIRLVSHIVFAGEDKLSGLAGVVFLPFFDKRWAPWFQFNQDRKAGDGERSGRFRGFFGLELPHLGFDLFGVIFKGAEVFGIGFR